MAQATTNTDYYPKAGVLARLGEWIATRIDAIGENNPYLRRVRALQALDDAALAARGLKREDIVREVFRDRFYL